METLREIMGLPFDDERRAKYNANSYDKRISEVIIDGVSIKGYKAFSFVRKLTYKKSPQRGGDGSLGNLNSYPVFSTPELQIDFSLLFIDDYRAIMNLIYARREHLVECYDIVRDTRVAEKMYFEPEELPNLWAVTRAIQGYQDPVVEVLGVRDYTIIMVGTNNPKDLVNVVYKISADSTDILYSEQIVSNQEILVGSGVELPYVSGLDFDNVWYRQLYEGRSSKYINNYAYSLVLESDEEQASKTITFVAGYRDSDEHTLTLAYGLGTPIIDIYNKQFSTVKFLQGETIKSAIARAKVEVNFQGSYLSGLPVSANPTVTINGNTYNTHYRQGWFYTAEIASNSTIVTDNTVLDFDRDVTIYEVFTPVSYNVRYVTNASTTINTLTNVTYGTPVPLPTILNQGFTFAGWYTDSNFQNKFGGTMPPYSLTLYAKWVQE